MLASSAASLSANLPARLPSSLLASCRGFSFGQARYHNGGQFGPVEEPFLTLCCVFCGEVEIQLDDQPPFRQTPAQLSLFYNSGPLLYRYPTGIDTHIGWIEAQPAMPAAQVIQLLSLLPGRIEHSERLVQLVRMGLALKPGADSDRAALEFNTALGAAALSGYMYEATRHAGEPELPLPARLALRYIQASYLYPIQLDDVARQAGVSPQYLTRLFRRSFAITPMRYVWRLRTLSAIDALRRSGASLSDIAAGCGYQTPYHLSRHIKVLTGLTPSEIRNGGEFQIGTDEMPAIRNIEF